VKSNSVLKVLNPVLAILVLQQAVTGVLHDFIPVNVFEIIHPVAGIALTLCAILHLSLNWSWIKTNILS